MSLEISLEEKIKELREKIGNEVNITLKKFEENKKISLEEKFLELVFCILVANCSMKKTFEIWKNIDSNFLKLSKEELSKKLKSFGYRFYNKRAEYIIEARNKITLIDEILKEEDEFKVRENLVKNFKGLGWKEASHFLRNLGYNNFAILDRHVLRVLKEFKIIEDVPKSLNKKTYLEIEGKLRELASKLNIKLNELDFYIFYISSGEIPIK